MIHHTMANASRNPDLSTTQAILFDLDGTLLDSFAAHFQAYKEMFMRFDIRVDKGKFLQTYSPDWYQTYEAFGLPRDRWKSADEYWLEAVVHQEPELLPGVRGTLRKLGKSMRLGLVSSGSRKRVMNDLVRNRISDFFEVIVTGDDTKSPKPHPEGILKAIDGMKLRPHEVLFVGDAEADYEMARAADIRFVGVKSSFAGLKSKSYLIVEGIGEIPAMLRKRTRK